MTAPTERRHGGHMADSVTFLASIAPLQSAIQIASDGGARVKIDIPESEMDAVVKLLGLREQVLRFRVEAET